jgi:hypothetical protein
VGGVSWSRFRADEEPAQKGPVIFDGRNLYDPGFVKREGFRYFAIGRADRVSDDAQNEPLLGFPPCHLQAIEEIVIPRGLHLGRCLSSPRHAPGQLR